MMPRPGLRFRVARALAIATLGIVPLAAPEASAASPSPATPTAATAGATPAATPATPQTRITPAAPPVTPPATPPITLHLEPATIEKAGIETIVGAASRFDQTVRGFGRVLDPAPIVDAVASVDALRAAEASARAEQQRVEALAGDDRNASLREVETARTLAARARADLAMARSRLVLQTGSGLARDPDLASWAHRLEDGRAALIRVDVPGSERPPAPERGVRFTFYPEHREPLDVRYVGRAATVDPTLPGFALLFLATSDPPQAGTPVIADCRTAASSETGVALPTSAVVYLGGKPFAWVELGGGRFERRAVETITREDGSLFVRRGLVPGERVVTVGAQQLLSSELLGAAAGAAE